MQVRLAYGRDGLIVDLPASARVITPAFVPGCPDEPEAIRSALRNPIGSRPLADLVRPGDRVVVTHTDITRATPNKRLLPVILSELEAAGVRRQDIALLNALGTHRPQTQAELRVMLGDELVDNYQCLQHDAQDDANLVSLGQTRLGHPVRINRTFLESDVRILTGFIEPHFFAGFSGGPKGVLPALAGAESVLSNHGREMIADPNATWGVTETNPIWEEMREVALNTNPTFIVNVTLNSRQEITGVFAGDMIQAHQAGSRAAKSAAMVPVDEPYEIVITTNSGYPLDQNLYQVVKGIHAGARIARQGGAIIVAAECKDGIPNHGKYAELLRKGGSPQGVLDMLAEPGFAEQDQWQVQLQALVQLKAEVFVYSGGLSEGQIKEALFTPSRRVEDTLAVLLERYGKDARVCVLPEGPMTIPYLSKQAG